MRKNKVSVARLAPTFTHNIDDRFLITEVGVPFKIVDKKGQILCTTVQTLMKPKEKCGFRVQSSDAIIESLKKVVAPFAKALKGTIVLMTPDEYAQWCEENPDGNIEDEPKDDDFDSDYETDYDDE